MHRQYIIDNDIVARYVKNELGDDERAAFEIFYLDDDDTLDELETLAAIENGLGVGSSNHLREESDAEPHSDEPSKRVATVTKLPRRQIWLLPVATAAALVVGIAVGTNLDRPDPNPMGAVLHSAVLVDFENVRGANDPNVEISSSNARLMLRVAVGSGESAYRLSLTGESDAELTSEPLFPDKHGDVAVVLEPQTLARGSYQLVATGVDSGETVLSAVIRVN